MKTLTYTFFDTDYAICLEKTAYTQNQNPAIRMWMVEDGQITEPFGSLSVNLGPIPEGYQEAGKIAVFLDTNHLPELPAFLEAKGLGKATGYVRQSGFCQYPLYLLDEAALSLYLID